MNVLGEKSKVDGVVLINPKPILEDRIAIISAFENIRSAARARVFEDIVGRFNLDCDLLIPEHPSFPHFKIHEGLLSIAAVLVDYGYRVDYLQRDWLERQGTWENMLDRACETSIVGITSYTPSYPLVIRLASEIKKVNPNCIIVLGGPHVSVMDVEAVKDGADIVVRGEGEKIMVELVRALEKGRNQLEYVKGITYNLNGKIKRNPPAKPPELDSLPTPAYHLVPEELRRESEVVIWTSRGCPYNCKFCTEKIFFGSVRFRSPRKVLSDLLEVKKHFKWNYVFITDSIFPLSTKEFDKYFNMFKKESVDFYFGCQLRANLANRDLIRKMVKMNFVEIYVGMESASDAMLMKMNKGETWADYVKFMKLAKDKIPFVITSWMVGYPGETYDSIYETAKKVDWLHEKNLITDSCPRVFIPYPGLPIFHQPRRYGVRILTHDYQKYSRKAFPAIHRLDNLNEFEIALASLQLYLIGMRHLARQAGMEDDISRVLESVKEC